MITCFHLDKDIFQSSDLLDRNPHLNHAILEHWQLYGCYIFNFASKEELTEWLDIFPIKYQQKWMLALESFQRFESKQEQIDIKSCETTQQLIDKIISLKADSLIFDCCENEISDLNLPELLPHNIEAFRPCDIYESTHFRNSKKFKDLDISDNESIKDVWSTRFNSLAKVSKKITIIDRYLAENSNKDHDRKSAIINFIELLPEVEHKYSISIYTAGDYSNSELHLNLENRFNKEIIKNKSIMKKVNMIHCCSIKNELFKSKSHDRLIAFDSFVCEVGVGMEIFRCLPIRNTTFNMKDIKSSHLSSIISLFNKNRLWTYQHIF